MGTISDLPNLLMFMSVLDLLSILNIISFRPALWQETYSGSDCLEDTEAYAKAKRLGKEIIWWFKAKCMIVVAKVTSDMIKGNTEQPNVKINDIHISYFVQQAAMLIQQAEEAKDRGDDDTLPGPDEVKNAIY
ncbi:hypothetical protein Moror_2061, partial [Moniliophthora roreri MCA 2997]